MCVYVYIQDTPQRLIRILPEWGAGTQEEHNFHIPVSLMSVYHANKDTVSLTKHALSAWQKLVCFNPPKFQDSPPQREKIDRWSPAMAAPPPSDVRVWQGCATRLITDRHKWLDRRWVAQAETLGGHRVPMDEDIPVE